jgi:hypothetical protein
VAVNRINKSIMCCGVVISSDGICNLDRKQRETLNIPRAHIRSIRLGYETRSKSPFCQFFLGFSLLFLGLLGIVVTFLASMGKVSLAQMQRDELALPLILIVLWIMAGSGFFFLLGVFRASYQLLVETEKETKRLFFDRSARPEKIRQFIRRASRDFDYRIDSSILDKMHPSG